MSGFPTTADTSLRRAIFRVRRPLGFTHRYLRIGLFRAITTVAESLDSKHVWITRFYALLGADYVRVGKISAAIEAYRAALARDDRRAPWHLALAGLLMKSRHFSAAAHAYEAAIACGAADANCYYELGRAHEQAQNWPAAARAFEGAVAIDPNKAPWQGRLAVVRRAQEKWNSAAEAFLAALKCDPAHESFRYQAARCLAKADREPEADALMQPVCAENDQYLRRFLAERFADGEIIRFHAKTMLVGGAQTRSARRIDVPGPDGQESFFEHTVQDPDRSANRQKFYETLWQAPGRATPDVLPELHYYVSGPRYTYFLYDFLPGNTSSWRMDEDRSVAIVDRLSEITTSLRPILGQPDNKAASSVQLHHVDAQSYLALAAQNAKARGDDASALQTLTASWPRHQARFNSLPQTLVHGDLNFGNVLVDKQGRVKIIDWDLSGAGPIALDLVHFFNGKVEPKRLEQMCDRYFDAIDPCASKTERRYTLAILALMWSIAKNQIPAEVWVRTLADA